MQHRATPSSKTGYHLAQANIARMIAPIDDPQMRAFVDALDPINALADNAPGFVWRYESGAEMPVIVPDFGDDILLNMSVWADVDSLHAYVFSSEHVGFLRARRSWFHREERPTSVLWWIPADTVPTIDDARRRLELLDRLGPTAQAFTFKDRFAQPADV